MEVVEQTQQLGLAAVAAWSFVVFGVLLALPALQRLIEQQRTQRAREREFVRDCRAIFKASSSCIVVTGEQWAELLQIIVLLPLGCVVAYSLIRDIDRYEYRVRRFLRRRRIRAIRARRLAA